MISASLLLTLAIPLCSQTSLVGETQKIQAPAPVHDLFYGERLAASDEVTLLASPRESRVWLYRNRAAALVLEQEIHEPLAYQFGWCIDVDGDRIAVGSREGNGLSYGTVHLYEFTGGAWLEQGRVPAPAGMGIQDGFADSLDLAGELLLVAGPGADHGHVDSGAAFVYRRGAAGWQLEQTLLPRDAGEGNLFGYRVAIASPERLVVSARWHGARGAVYVFELAGGVWQEVARLRSEAESPGSRFGWSLAADGNRLFVGQEENFLVGPGMGSVWVYTQAAGRYRKTGMLAAPDSTPYDQFSGRIAATAGRALVAGLDRNQVYLYEEAEGVWSNTARLLPAQVHGYAFGDQIAITRERALVTDSGDSEVAHQSGALYSFDLTAVPVGLTFCLSDGLTVSCPCGNDVPASALTGCGASHGLGTRLVAAGSTSVSADDLVLGADGLPFNKSAILFGGPVLHSPAPFGDGLICVGSPAQRFGWKPWRAYHWGPYLGSLAGWGEGQTWGFQAYFRDQSGPCGSGFQATSAVAITFTP